MAMMHTKLIRMKWGMLWNILQDAGVRQGQVGGLDVLHYVRGMVHDGHDTQQINQDEVENVLYHTTGGCS
jgi:hypothetical protein